MSKYIIANAAIASAMPPTSAIDYIDGLALINVYN
jgi:hypothetical protein